MAALKKYFDWLDNFNERTSLIPTAELTGPAMLQEFPDLQGPEHDPQWFTRQVIEKWMKQK